MKKYRFAVFDLDGTLLNTIEDLAAAVNFTLKKHGIPQRPVSEIKTFIGNGAAVLVAKSAGIGVDDPALTDMLEDFKDYYSLHSDVFTKPYEGIEYVIETLCENGIKCAIASNKFDRAVKIINEKYFKGRFETAIGEGNGIKRKPAPDMVFKAMEIMGADKDNTVYIGDSPVDIKVAKNCGIDCISVLWGFRPKQELIENGAQIMIEKAEDMLKYFI